MKSLLTLFVSPSAVWQTCYLLTGVYLLFHPALGHPQSYAVALGGGLLLLIFRSIAEETFGVMGKAWWFFLVLLLASSFWSLSPGVTLQSAGFFFLGTLLYLQVRSLEGPAQGRILAVGLLLACVASMFALEQWRSGFQQVAAHLSELPQEDLGISTAWAYNKRASGILVNPAALGALMIFFIPIGMVLFQIHSGSKKILSGFATLLLVLGLLAAKSVGACACLTLAVLAVYFGRKFAVRPPGSSKVWPLAVLAAGAAAVFVLVWERGLQSWLLASFSVRLELWKSAGILFLQHPWIGSGFGTFEEAYRQAGLSLVTGSRFAHNFFFQFLVETGVIGAGLLSWAMVGFFRRLKAPVRWEGWGVLTGLLAVVLFGLLDIPFQMPELVWVFAGTAGLLELRPEKKMVLPQLPIRWFETGLLAVLLVSGFWHPFVPWNFTLVALALWAGLALFQQTIAKIPLWIFAGALFMALRAFMSPSAMGTVWFLEIAGLLLAFGLLKRIFPNQENFFRLYCLLGIFWALRVWILSFEYSDIKDWDIFPNPKQVGTFLLPFLFLAFVGLGKGKISEGLLARLKDPKTLILLAFVSVTLFRLNAYGAMVAAGAGIVAGFFFLIPKKWRFVLVAVACVFTAGVLTLRSAAFKDLDKNPTHYDRLGFWKAAVEVWQVKPLIGVGPGAFEGLYHQVKSPRDSGINRYLMDVRYAHNEFLDLLAAFGLVGFLWVFALLKSLWPARGQPEKVSAVTALSAASFIDFCLHTPLIALQGIWLLTSSQRDKPKSSWPGGLLAAGLVLGLFGSAIFADRLVKKSEQFIQEGHWKEARHPLVSAERLNAWDARVVMARADYFEQLYYKTKDPVWARHWEATFEKAMDLEKANGQMSLRKAERLTAMLSLDPSAEKSQKTRKAWAAAEKVLPLNAFVYFEEGVFYRALALGSGKSWNGDGLWALRSFQRATQLEPNFASAWKFLGICRMDQMMESQARWDFEKALEVHDRWKDAERVASLEKKMVGLSLEELEFLKKAVAP